MHTSNRSPKSTVEGCISQGLLLDSLLNDKKLSRAFGALGDRPLMPCPKFRMPKEPAGMSLYREAFNVHLANVSGGVPFGGLKLGWSFVVTSLEVFLVTSTTWEKRG